MHVVWNVNSTFVYYKDPSHTLELYTECMFIFVFVQLKTTSVRILVNFFLTVMQQ